MTRTDRDPDRFTRESFSMRGMTRWQAWAMTIVAAAVIAAALAYSLT